MSNRRSRRNRRAKVESDDEEEENEMQYSQRHSQMNPQDKSEGMEENDERANQNDEKSEYSEDDKMIPEEISLDKEDYEEKLSQERGYNEEEMNGIVGNVMNFILLKNSQRIPVKMSAISKIIARQHRQSRLSNDMVMKIVKKRFMNIFGYELRKLQEVYENSKQSSKREKRKRPRSTALGTNTFILMNANKNAKGIKRLNILAKSELPIQGLLMTIYSLILLNKGPIMSVKLWECLKKLGIKKNTHHPLFGNVDELIRVKFVKQMYLTRSKKKDQLIMQSQSDDPAWQYDFGKRGLTESSKTKIFEFTHKVIGKELDKIRFKVFQTQEEQEAKDAELMLSQSQK
mmetsp:Transcript_23933/g.38461  ORF Transcript_23933/g.38461 Transcript_23933/m.38461 type:complete len:345 (+) Transcript_23933:81-1115(+)